MVQGLRSEFSKRYRDEYKAASVSYGYIDSTYFYLQNDYLQQRKLKPAIVLNHRHVNFELWLLGQTKEVHVDYWRKLRKLEWVNSQEIPKYYIFETALLSKPNFDNRDQVFKAVLGSFELLSSKVLSELRTL